MNSSVINQPNVYIPEDTKSKLLEIFSMQGKSIDEGVLDMTSSYIKKNSTIKKSKTKATNGKQATLDAIAECKELMSQGNKGVSFDEYFKDSSL